MAYYTTPLYGVALKTGTDWVLEKQGSNNAVYSTSDLTVLQNTYIDDHAPSEIKYLLFIEVDSNYRVQNPFNANLFDDFVVSYTTSPPTSEPTVGSKYIVKETGLQGWAGEDNKIAVYINDTDPYDTSDDTQWRFVTPIDGYKVNNKTDNTIYTWNTTIAGNWSS